MDDKAALMDYVSAVKAKVKQLFSELGQQDLLGGWHRGVFPRTGLLSDGSVYSFHGVGCSIESPDGIVVDFDFGAGGRCGGFDAWRVWMYISQFPNRYCAIRSQKDVEILIGELIEKGVVVMGDCGDRLLYVSGDSR